MYLAYECTVFEGYKNIKNKNGYYLVPNKSFYIKVFIINLELCNYIKIIPIIKKIICAIQIGLTEIFSSQ